MIGIIGAGNIGLVHAKSVIDAGYNISGIYDLSQKNSEIMAQKYGGKICNDLQDLFELKETLGVIIATPNFTHVNYAIKALDAGKYVLLEKPASISFKELSPLLKHENAKSHLLFGLVCRESKSTLHVKSRLQKYFIGDIFHVQMTLTRFRGIPGLGSWFTDKNKSGGGVLIDLGIHILDLGWYLSDFSLPIRVSSVTRNDFGNPINSYRYEEMWSGPPIPSGICNVEDSVRAFFRHSNNKTSSLELAWATNVDSSFHSKNIILHGTKGSVAFDILGNEVLWSKEINGLSVIETELWSKESSIDYGFIRQTKNFIKLIQRKIDLPSVGFNEIKDLSNVIDAIYESSQVEKEVGVITPSANKS